MFMEIILIVCKFQEIIQLKLSLAFLAQQISRFDTKKTIAERNRCDDTSW